MKHPVDVPLCLTLLLIGYLPISTEHESISISLYRKVTLGDIIVGRIASGFSARSLSQCSNRCSSDSLCVALQYDSTRNEECFIIHRNSTAEDGVTFMSNLQSILFKKEQSEQSVEPAELDYLGWNRPDPWTGPAPVFYVSFDNASHLALMEATLPASFPLTTGQINKAVVVDQVNKQWVDLGILDGIACISRPESCGAAGAAVTFWLKRNLVDTTDRGIVGSRAKTTDDTKTCFLISHRNNKVFFYMWTPNGRFSLNLPPSSPWTHYTLQYIGPENGQGIRVYENGKHVGSDTTRSTNSFPPGVGRVVVGRWYHDHSGSYNSISMDELIFFSQTLTDQQVMAIKNL